MYKVYWKGWLKWNIKIRLSYWIWKVSWFQKISDISPLICFISCTDVYWEIKEKCRKEEAQGRVQAAGAIGGVGEVGGGKAGAVGRVGEVGGGTAGGAE